MSKSLTPRQIKDKLWRLGNLEWKLKGIQKRMRKDILDHPKKRSTFLASRRTGKSFVMCAVATEQCIKKKNSIVKYVCPKQRMVKTIVKPIMRTILDDCPIDLMPEYIENEKVYRFPNGSEIQFAGSDHGNIENLRGGFADLCLVDEAGFVDDLNYAVYSVLSPTTKTVGGKLVLASTPSREPDHEFMRDFVTTAQDEGNLIKYTIYDNPLFTPSIIQETIDEYPLGEDDPQFQREYLCRSAVDLDVQVIPEFDDDLERDIVKQVEIPVYYDGYVSGDPATSDLTVILFAFYDFLNRKLVIMDELVLGGSGKDLTTQDIADGIFRKEKMIFSNPLTGELQKPYKRVMDNNFKILINDLNHEHGLDFIPTAKDNKEAQINMTRMMLKRGEIIIHPQCTTLRYHIRTARWSKSRKGFVRIKGTSDGKFKAHHADAVDALIYLVRNLDKSKNPYPDEFFNSFGNDVHQPSEKNNKFKDIMCQIMNIKDK